MAERPDPRTTHAINWQTRTISAYIDADWEATYRIGVDGDQLVITGVGIRPRSAGTIPPGGLTARALRELRPGLALGLFQSELAEWVSGDNDAVLRGVAALEMLGQGEAGLTALREESRQHWTGWEAALAKLDRGTVRGARLARLAVVARRYAAAVDRGERAPIQVIAAELGQSPSRVRDDVHAARVEGLLSPSPGRGRRGGALQAADGGQTIKTPGATSQIPGR